MASSSKINVMIAVVVLVVSVMSIGEATAARRLQQMGGFPSFPMPTNPGFPSPSTGGGFPSFPMPTTPSTGFGGLPNFPFPSFPNTPADPNVPAQTTTP
ncbi:vacuolar protein sorting-associated protein VTA1 homolog [Solanum tuberosum]|uniref:vacuolar protein sorting-associated protein VTA1 homolog n=1 Tax=Solanum tuberosum TaxID=4113 RepID=UPI00073A325F|nr:PREDICTED: vacuolar protein sorting-associated protein VTA1 homolog [Solanum tuberosum]